MESLRSFPLRSHVTAAVDCAHGDVASVFDGVACDLIGPEVGSPLLHDV